VSDDIAYNAHDLDDGLRAGLFTLDDVMALPLAGPIFRAVAERHPDADSTRRVHVSLSKIIGAMVDDVITESARRQAVLKPKDAATVRALGQPLVGFSETMAAHDKSLKEFLFAHMYRHTKVNRMTSKARRVVRDLFGLLLAEPELLPEDWRTGGLEPGSLRTARRVADYIAGMTDRFALDEHSRLFDPAVKP
jgi:dGTPase